MGETLQEDGQGLLHLVPFIRKVPKHVSTGTKAVKQSMQGVMPEHLGAQLEVGEAEAEVELQNF